MKKQRSTIKVTPHKDGVRFSIDHQGFNLLVDQTPEPGCTARQRNNWYARMLRIALKRLAGQGL